MLNFEVFDIDVVVDELIVVGIMIELYLGIY